jgi:hypothetical protein
MIMNGPAAPKDPEKKRPYFYIMKDKEIFGAKQEDGSAIHFIYESDGSFEDFLDIGVDLGDIALNIIGDGGGIRQACTQYRGVC